MKIMKRICTILLMALFINGSVIAAEELKLVSLSVPTMNCAMCPITVSKSLMNVQGVQTADASLAKGVVEVSFNDEVANIDALLAATKNAGYPSYLLEQH